MVKTSALSTSVKVACHLWLFRCLGDSEQLLAGVPESSSRTTLPARALSGYALRSRLLQPLLRRATVARANSWRQAPRTQGSSRGATLPPDNGGSVLQQAYSSLPAEDRGALPHSLVLLPRSHNELADFLSGAGRPRGINYRRQQGTLPHPEAPGWRL